MSTTDLLGKTDRCTWHSNISSAGRPAHSQSFSLFSWLLFIDYIVFLWPAERVSEKLLEQVWSKHKMKLLCYLAQTWLQSRPVSRSWGLAGRLTGCPGVADGGRGSLGGCSPSRTSRAATPPRRAGGSHPVFSRCHLFRRKVTRLSHQLSYWPSDMLFQFLRTSLFGTTEMNTVGRGRWLLLALFNDTVPIAYVIQRRPGDLCIKLKNENKRIAKSGLSWSCIFIYRK